MEECGGVPVEIGVIHVSEYFVVEYLHSGGAIFFLQLIIFACLRVKLGECA